MEAVAARGQEYNGFNLIVADASSLWYYGNRDPQGPRALKPGLYGLSNALLDTSWPKVDAGKAAIAASWDNVSHDDAACWLDLMHNAETAPEDKLPQTGVPLELEKALSATFIITANRQYGTRVSTLVRKKPDQQIFFAERSYYPEPTTRQFSFEAISTPV